MAEPLGLGDGFIFEATDLKTGRVKAKLRPVSVEWTETLSEPSSGTFIFATGDLSVSDVWPHLTGIYISRVIKNPGSIDTRQCLFGGFIEADAIPQSPQTISVGFVSMDKYLSHRVMANEDGGLEYTVDDREQTLIAKDYVDFAAWNGIPLTAIAEPSEFEQERSYTQYEYKNLGAALQDLCATINGPEYTLEHNYSEPGHWASVIRFQDVVGEDRNLLLKSDVDGLNCGLASNAQNHSTRTYAIGAGEEVQQLVSIAHDSASIYPEFQTTPAWKDVSDVATLERQAVGHVASFRDPVTTPTMSVAGMFPDPDDMRVGDTVSALIIAKSFRFGDPENPSGPDGKARLLAVAWRISVEGVLRTLTLQPVIRPALSILVKSIIPPETPGVPGGDGEPVAGLVTTIKDPRITESSGMAHNLGDAIYTHNDEGESPQVYLIDLATGNTIGEWALSGVSSLSDPESIRLDPVDGSLWIADIGDNDGDRSTKRLIQTSIPSSGASSNFNITYPGGVKVNAEALLIHPTTGEKYVATKESVGRLINYGVSPSGSGSLVYQTLPGNISDGTFSPDGRFMLFTSAGQAVVYVVDFASGTTVGTIPIDSLPKGESITMSPEGKSFLVGTEGANSPIYRVILPVEFRAPGAGGGSSPNGLPSGLIDLTNWKLTLPIGGPTEIKQPALATFEDASWFYDDGPDVVFRANAGGATTSGSSYPRSELREMTNGGQSNASWSTSQSRTMTVVESISYGTLVNKRHVVGAQVHDADDDVCVIRLENTSLWLTDGDNAHGTLITSSYVPGTMFEVKFVSGGNNIAVYFNGSLVANRGGSRSGCYFKAGCYTQSNTSSDSAGAYGEVRIRSLVVT